MHLADINWNWISTLISLHLPSICLPYNSLRLLLPLLVQWSSTIITKLQTKCQPATTHKRLITGRDSKHVLLILIIKNCVNPASAICGLAFPES